MKRLYYDFINYLVDILDAINKIQTFIKGQTFEQFFRDDKSQFAVIRAFEIIGEASKKLLDSVKQDNPNIPWKVMAGIEG
ncbi:MAG: HepT-like ribonuclease domain-containing protein [candidate division KSB1 bacterium]|nr:HepT-like ribonuclease domain-containing protein [candidate division KSB1 bacterium]